MKPAPAPRLAYCYQEILTVAARLRSGRINVGDPAVFRTQVRRALQQSESFAQSLGGPPEDVRLASFAVTSLLDETILYSSNPAFRDWAQKPLMLDLYGTLHAGETFFEYLTAILNRREDSAAMDLMEVYLLCLMLGFRGRYSSASGDLQAWRDPAIEKILRFRGAGDTVELSHSWLPEGAIDLPAPSNRWTRIALSASLAFLGACVVLLAAYSLLLGRGVSELARLAP